MEDKNKHGNGPSRPIFDPSTSSFCLPLPPPTHPPTHRQVPPARQRRHAWVAENAATTRQAGPPRARQGKARRLKVGANATQRLLLVCCPSTPGAFLCLWCGTAAPHRTARQNTTRCSLSYDDTARSIRMYLMLHITVVWKNTEGKKKRKIKTCREHFSSASVSPPRPARHNYTQTWLTQRPARNEHPRRPPLADGSTKQSEEGRSEAR